MAQHICLRGCKCWRAKVSGKDPSRHYLRNLKEPCWTCEKWNSKWKIKGQRSTVYEICINNMFLNNFYFYCRYAMFPSLCKVVYFFNSASFANYDVNIVVNSGKWVLWFNFLDKIPKTRMVFIWVFIGYQKSCTWRIYPFLIDFLSSWIINEVENLKAILLSYIETAISWESSAWGSLLRVRLRKLQTNLRQRLNELTKWRVVDAALKKKPDRKRQSISLARINVSTSERFFFC